MSTHASDTHASGEFGAHGGAESARITPFEALEIDLGRWWLEEEPPAT
ncbi:MAG TPA: hypothetical protein VF515_07870 [Candidatus Binatia bacterium]